MKLSENKLLFLYLFFDLILLNIAIMMVGFVVKHTTPYYHLQLTVSLLHGNLAWIITYFIFSKKNLYLRDGFKNRIRRIVKRTTIFLLVGGILAFLFLPILSKHFLLEYTFVFFILKIVFYWVLYTYLKYARKEGKHTQRILIVGLNDTSRLLRTIIDSNPMLGYQFIGYVSKHPLRDNDVIGDRDQLADLIKQQNIQMVFVTLSLFSESNQGKDFLKICNSMGVRLRFVPENQNWFKSRANMESVGDFVVINPQEIPLDDIEARCVKRIFDIIISLTAIICVFSWLFPIIALIIKLTSKGPVFFVQERTGINNKTFKCLKFRSMKVNKDANTKQAQLYDDRITKIGRFMRKTNIDELPQFINVLLGQMSVIGPRPHMLKHTEEYSKLIDHYLIRHYVKPGVTGWAQVNGYRGETDQLWKMEKRVEYDMNYIENWSLWWDVRILVMTFGKATYKNAF